MKIRRIAVCGAVLACCWVPTRATAQSTTAFAAYCKAEDHSEWLCEQRASPLSEAQKWDVVAAYCMDYVGHAASRTASALKAGTDMNLSPPKGKKEVCDLFQIAPVPLALRYDHRRGEWEDNGEVFEVLKRALKLDPVTKIPTAQLRGGDRIGIVVTETNPLVFAANRGEAREDNIEAIKNLEKLLGLLGGALGPLVADQSVAAATAAGRTPGPEERDRDRIRLWAQALEKPLKTLGDKLKALVDVRARIQLAAQMLENGPAPFRGALDDSLEQPGVWRTLFEGLSTAVDAAPNLQACATVFEAFPEVTTADTPTGADAATVRLLQLLNVANPPCDSALEYPGSVEQSTREIQRAARAAAAGGASELTAFRQRQARARAENLEHVLVLHRMMTQLSATRQSARDTLLKEEDTRKAAVALKIVAGRVRDAAFRKDGDQRILVNRIYLADEVFDTSWTKIRVTPLKVAVNSPYADHVPSSRPKDVSTTYRLVRQNFDRFSVAAGLVYTKAASTIYTALDPDPSTNRTTTVSEKTTKVEAGTTTDTSVQTVTPELKVITEKERQSRAGSYGLFANYRIGQHGWLGIGVQGGVALSADNPAFYGGVAFNAGSYLTLGAGCGAFRVKGLGKGPSGQQQEPGDPVVGNDDIRTDSRWSHACSKDAFYVTISLNLSGLPLFAAK